MSHKIEIYIGPNTYGWNTRLVCPEGCIDEGAHQQIWSDVGMELLMTSEKEVVLATVEVEPEWQGSDEDAELWLNPVVFEAETEVQD